VTEKMCAECVGSVSAWSEGSTGRRGHIPLRLGCAGRMALYRRNGARWWRYARSWRTERSRGSKKPVEGDRCLHRCANQVLVNTIFIPTRRRSRRQRLLRAAGRLESSSQGNLLQ